MAQDSDQDADRTVSRRRWVGMMSAPLVAAGLSSTLLADDRSVAAGVADNRSGARVFDVRDFGARGDGLTLDTAAVQAAIDACAKDRGGIVLVPAADFL